MFQWVALGVFHFVSFFFELPAPVAFHFLWIPRRLERGRQKEIRPQIKIFFFFYFKKKWKRRGGGERWRADKKKETKKKIKEREEKKEDVSSVFQDGSLTQTTP